MEKGLVTVIVPVYKTEKYLDRCVESIVNQTYQNLEIILVDDGSPDNCPQMCDAWAQKDPRIRVIHKTNEGQGIARNAGLKQTNGEYVYFVDSDDYIALDTIEKAYGLAVQEKAEIVIFGFYNVNAEGTVCSSFVPAQVPTFRGEAVREAFLADLIAIDPKGNGERKFYLSACMTLFSMKLIRKINWHFVSERVIISEENYSVPELLRYAQSVAVLPESLYFYCENAASFSRKYMPGRYKKIAFFYEACLELCDRLGYGDEIKRRFARPYIDFTIAAMKQTMASSQKVGTKIQEISEVLRDPLLQKVLEEQNADRVNWKQKSLFWTVRNKKVLLCCALLTAQNVLDRR